MDEGIQVIKLGGSLLDMPGLVPRFEAYRQAEICERALLVVGGGRLADAVRQFDLLHGLGPERGHWMAVRAMQVNAHMVAGVLTSAVAVDDARECNGAWNMDKLAIMDPLVWLVREVQNGITVPHRWSFTSDSIAAHVATQLGAARLTLLKSTSPEQCNDLQSLAEQGIVDEDFPVAAAKLPLVETVNLRVQPWTRCEWRSPA